MVFCKVPLNVSMSKQGKNILLCTDNCVTQPQDMQFQKQANLCFTHHTTLYKDKLQLDSENVTFSSYVSINNKLITHGATSIDQWQDDHEGGRGSGEEEGDKRDSEPILNCTNAHADYTTLTTYFHMHSTGKHDEQNTLNLEKSYLHASINAIFHLLIRKM